MCVCFVAVPCSHSLPNAVIVEGYKARHRPTAALGSELEAIQQMLYRNLSSREARERFLQEIVHMHVEQEEKLAVALQAKRSLQKVQRDGLYSDIYGKFLEWLKKYFVQFGCYSSMTADVSTWYDSDISVMKWLTSKIIQIVTRLYLCVNELLAYLMR